jgi:hypothetical protein
MPHLMFYAPKITNEDIGAVPTSSLLYPFAFKEGIAEPRGLFGEHRTAKALLGRSDS